MKPELSIIIPACNEEDYITKTLDALKVQTSQNFETIIVTNGCTDNTEKVIKPYLSNTTRHLSLPKANVSVARNAGALNASAPLLFFLDADTLLKENAIEKITTKFSSKHAVATLKAAPDTNKITHHTIMGFKNAYMMAKLYKAFAGSLICRKQDFHEVGGFDPSIIVREHFHFQKKLKEKGKYTVINTPAITSMRRFEQWGLAKAAKYWLSQLAKSEKELKEIKEYEKVR